MRPLLRVLLVFFVTFATTAAGSELEYHRWDQLPEADPDRRTALVEAVVRELPTRWMIEDGGWSPEPGLEPTFRHTCAALIGLYEAPQELLVELGIDREHWTSTAVSQMVAAQIRDSSDNDPSAFPHSLYGSVLYPGWKPENEWPRQRSNYIWDQSVPPLLARLLHLHRGALPTAVEEDLEQLLWFAADGALNIWYQVRFLEQDPTAGAYRAETGQHLSYIQALILGGELSGHEQARRVGEQALAAFVNQIRSTGVAEFASPERSALHLDGAAFLASASRSAQVQKSAVNLWLYLWVDLALSLAPGDEDGPSLGGPSAWSYQPLIPAGGHRDHLYLSALNESPAVLDPIQAARATIDRRPPSALITRLLNDSSLEAAACWGDKPGQDRSWWREDGLQIGVSSASAGTIDRVLAVELASPAARIHFSAGRGDGSAGLPSGVATGHNPLFVSAVRAGRSALVIAEAHPLDLEERVLPTLFLPAAVDGVWLDGENLELPTPGEERFWEAQSGQWLTLAVDRWWLAVSSLDLAPDLLTVIAPADAVGGARVLQLQARPVTQGQSITQAVAIVVTRRESQESGASFSARLEQTSFDLRLTVAGYESSLSGGVVEQPLTLVHDPINHQLADRTPSPPTVCQVGAPLIAPGLSWNDGALTISGPTTSWRIDLGPEPGPRRGGNRQ